MNGKWGGGLAWVGWVCSDRNINRNNEVIVGFRPVYVDKGRRGLLRTFDEIVLTFGPLLGFLTASPRGITGHVLFVRGFFFFCGFVFPKYVEKKQKGEKQTSRRCAAAPAVRLVRGYPPAAEC